MVWIYNKIASPIAAMPNAQMELTRPSRDVSEKCSSIGLLPDTGCAYAGNAGNVFPATAG